jgi:hypothetical protein
MWVALVEIQEGSGELKYVEGWSHLLVCKSCGDSKNWDTSIHGEDSPYEWAKWLLRKSEELGLGEKMFRPKRGDVLVSSAEFCRNLEPLEHTLFVQSA